MTSMHVTHVNTERDFSGGENQVFMLIKQLSGMGVSNSIITLPGSDSARVAHARGIPCELVPMKNSFDVRAAWRLSRVLDKQNVDLVHLHTGRAAWLGGIAARIVKLPAIATRRMDRPITRGWKTRMIHHSLLDHQVAISPAVHDLLLDAGANPTRTHMIYDAVDISDIRIRASRGTVRDELGLKDMDFVILCLAALVHRKGIDVFLEALAKLRVRGIPAVGLIAGQGPELAKLKGLASHLNIADKVRFLGWRNDPGALIGASELTVLPSRREGLGVAALEAMALGGCVVGTEVGGLGQVIESGTTGLLVPSEDPAGLAAALLHLHQYPHLRISFGQAAAKATSARFSARKQALAYLDLYRLMLLSRDSA